MSQSELVREWGAWIDSLAKWDWFITLTFKPTVALKYDPSRGAAAYISKYVVKELGDITWSDNLGVRTNVLEAGLAPFLKPAPRLEEPPEPLRVDLLPNEIRWLEIANRPHSGAVGRLREVDPPRHV